MRTCIFCGGRPTTREHAWPGWLRRRLPDEGTLQHTGLLELHGEVKELFSYDDRTYKATARVVCARCNNGWMSREEEVAKTYLGGMVDRRGRELHAGGQAELAKWALLKAIIFDHAAPGEAQTNDQALPGYLYRHGEPPSEGCRIWLAAYGGELPGFTAMTALSVAADGQPYTEERNVWVRTFSIGPVVFQVFTTTNPALANYEPGWTTLPDPPRVIRIWPTGETTHWLPGPALNDRGMIWFANHIIATMIRSSDEHRPG